MHGRQTNWKLLAIIATLAMALPSGVSAATSGVVGKPGVAESHLAQAKALWQKAQTEKGTAAQADLAKAKSELKAAIRLGRGSNVARQANQFMLKHLPASLISPRSGEGTELIAARLGLRSGDRGIGAGAPKAKLYEFYASWCEPCKQLQPVMQKIQQQYRDQIEVESIDVDDTKNADIVEQYDISPIPTVIYMNQDGQVVGYSIGYSGEQSIQKQLQKILPNKS